MLQGNVHQQGLVSIHTQSEGLPSTSSQGGSSGDAIQLIAIQHHQRNTIFLQNLLYSHSSVRMGSVISLFARSFTCFDHCSLLVNRTHRFQQSLCFDINGIVVFTLLVIIGDMFILSKHWPIVSKFYSWYCIHMYDACTCLGI